MRRLSLFLYIYIYGENLVESLIPRNAADVVVVGTIDVVAKPYSVDLRQERERPARIRRTLWQFRHDSEVVHRVQSGPELPKVRSLRKRVDLAHFAPTTLLRHSAPAHRTYSIRNTSS